MIPYSVTTYLNTLMMIEKLFVNSNEFLKPGGMAIMQVPLDPDYEFTDEDPTIKDPAERERRVPSIRPRAALRSRLS